MTGVALIVVCCRMAEQRWLSHVGTVLVRKSFYFPKVVEEGRQEALKAGKRTDCGGGVCVSY